MKALIIYISVHHGNTEKIAQAMAEVLKAKVVKPREIDINTDTLSEYDLIGFGSGIYFGKHHKSLLNFVDKLPMLNNKKAFIFSTSGVRNGIAQMAYGGDFNRAIKKKLSEKEFNIIGEFSCRGFDTVGPFKLIGGINKGRPNEKDLRSAEDFAKSLEEKIK